MFRAHGWTGNCLKKILLQKNLKILLRLFNFVLPGYNIRPLELSGAIGKEQLKKFGKLISQRRKMLFIFRK